jgi:hypothetical protein
MISPRTLKTTPIPSHDLAAQLKQLGLVLTADSLDDLLARAATGIGARANCWRKSPAPKPKTGPAAASNDAWLRPASSASNP